MSDSDVEDRIARVVGHFRGVPGVTAFVLGGSQARGTAVPGSDIDVALYYTPETLFDIDIDTLQRVAQAVDDEHRPGLMTGVGAWGSWINGGGNLKVGGQSVDMFYRDIQQVTDVIEQCRSGVVNIEYLPGFPSGYLSSTYMGEVALCRVEWDPHDMVKSLKAQTVPYPMLLQRSLIRKFSWDARFVLENARKGVFYLDVPYIAGCLRRSAHCLAQILFAVNQRYWINERNEVAVASTLPQTPTRFAERITEAFTALSDSEGALMAAIQTVEALVDETMGLVN